MKKRIFSVIALALFFLSVSLGWGHVPDVINFQGMLSDSAGIPISGNRTMQFSIYGDSVGGAPLWGETHNSVEVSEGIFQVILGTSNHFPTNLFNDDDLWLTIRIDVSGQELLPRIRFVSTPYSIKSGESDHATTSDSSDYASYPDSSVYDYGRYGVADNLICLCGIYIYRKVKLIQLIPA